MFYYKITVRKKQGKDARSSRNVYREFTKAAFVGEYVGTKLAAPNVTSVSVTRITQKHYQRATA